MSDANHHNDDFEAYDDVEEYVDLDEHDRARADARRKKIRDERNLQRHEDTLDEYAYGEDSGEAFTDEDDR